MVITPSGRRGQIVTTSERLISSEHGNVKVFSMEESVMAHLKKPGSVVRNRMKGPNVYVN